MQEPSGKDGQTKSSQTVGLALIWLTGATKQGWQEKTRQYEYEKIKPMRDQMSARRSKMPQSVYSSKCLLYFYCDSINKHQLARDFG